MTDVKQILAERGKVHGDYTDQARVSQAFKDVAHLAPNWPRLTDVQKETLEMNCLKMARILCGDPDHQDHWDDIAGYATLVSERLPKPGTVTSGEYAITGKADASYDAGADAKSARPFITNTPRGKDDPRHDSQWREKAATSLGKHLREGDK